MSRYREPIDTFNRLFSPIFLFLRFLLFLLPLSFHPSSVSFASFFLSSFTFSSSFLLLLLFFLFSRSGFPLFYLSSSFCFSDGSVSSRPFLPSLALFCQLGSFSSPYSFPSSLLLPLPPFHCFLPRIFHHLNPLIPPYLPYPRTLLVFLFSSPFHLLFLTPPPSHLLQFFSFVFPCPCFSLVAPVLLRPVARLSRAE